GEKIGIIGATTEDTPDIASPGPDVEFTDVIQYVRGASEALDAAGVNKIILLSHIGYTIDQEVAASLPLVDVIVGGHSHSLLGSMDGAAGPYPTMVNNPDGIEVPVVQANQYGKYLGNIAITWDDNGVVTKAEGEPFLIDASVTANADFADQLQELLGPIEELTSTVIGTATDKLEGAREVCRVQECSMGNLLADAILDRVAGQG